jgi:hypothetical protein
VCPILTPSHLFIGSGQLRENGVSTPRMDEEPTRRHHMVAAHWQPQGRFGRPVGSADPLWAPMTVCFCEVAIRWVLKSVLGFHGVWRWFGHVCGP